MVGAINFRVLSCSTLYPNSADLSDHHTYPTPFLKCWKVESKSEEILTLIIGHTSSRGTVSRMSNVFVSNDVGYVGDVRGFSDWKEITSAIFNDSEVVSESHMELSEDYYLENTTPNLLSLLDVCAGIGSEPLYRRVLTQLLEKPSNHEIRDWERTILEILLNKANHPVLVHCNKGKVSLQLLPHLYASMS